MKGQNKDQRPQTQILQGLAEITDYAMISDERVDNPVERFMSDHGTLFGYSGLKVNDQLVAYATRFSAVRLKNHVWSHHHDLKAKL